MNLRTLAPFALVAACASAHAQKLDLPQNAHVTFLGNALADRMQHSGWLETLIQQKLADKQLVFRNLAVAADEVNTWHRSEAFGSRDEWLTWTQTDVIFAFYGFNESFAGYEGVAKFKENLTKFITDAAKQNYGGKGAPKIVLFSPIAAERHMDPNFADPKEINERLQNYVAAMADVAKVNGLQFVDLYASSQQIYKDAAAKGVSLTQNGIHLTDAGEKALAPLIFKQLFGEDAPAANAKLNAAVVEKNWQWHQRYRTIDGYNVYGGRSRMSYKAKDKDGKEGRAFVNNEVMQQEMQQRDVMTANRDKRVWAVAKGGDLVVKDDNLPEVVKVETNKPGDKPDGSWTYPTGAQVLDRMKSAPGCKVNLFADDTMFPDLINPVQQAWDTKGRLWVAAWTTYPEAWPTTKNWDKLIVLEDTNNDGKADKCTTFVDQLNGPTGFTFHKDGVILMQAPDLVFLRDTNGDGKADTKERLVMGMDSADSHHTTNALGHDPGGAIYLSDGVFHRTQVETAVGPKRHSDGIIWRFEPATGKFEQYAPYGFANPHGKTWDKWGNGVITDATGNANYFDVAFSGYLDNGKHSGYKEFWKRPSRPCPATGTLSSRHFPDDWQQNFLNLNVIGLQAVTRVAVTQDGSGIKGETVEHIVSGDPAELPTFRPISVSVGPDGALYFGDWAQTIIGHLQHNLRDPNRDHQHGSIYRVTYEGRPLVKAPKIDGQPLDALLDVLKVPEDGTRELTKVEISKYEPAKISDAVKKWVGSLDKNHADFEHHLLEALWVRQWNNIPDTELLKRVLSSPEPRARAAAVRVLGYWRDRVPGAIDLLKVAANDADPRVRLHAVRGASFFSGADVPAAFDVVFSTLTKETDYYIDYTFKETLKQLNSLSKEPYFPKDPAIIAAYIGKMDDKTLNSAPDVEPVLIARIDRKATEAAKRDQALVKLAKLKGTSKPVEAVAALARGAASSDELGKLLVTATAADLKAARPSLEAALKNNPGGGVGRAIYAALITADDAPGAVWNAAADSAAKNRVLDSLALIANPPLRAKFQQLLAAAVASDATRSSALKALPLMGAEHAAANFTLLANALRSGQDRATAARALMQLPRTAWNKDAAGPVAEAVLTWAKGVPAGDRTKQDYIETAGAAAELAGLLAPAETTRMRKELRSLGVPVFVIHTVHEQMRYDNTRIVVEAGKPFELILENSDTMPHNLVIVKPGQHEKIGTAASTMTPDKTDKQGRAYIPKDWEKEIIEATKVIEPGQKETIKVKAPTEEGEYEYVCTMPGHFVVMWGKLIVTKNVDAALAASGTTAPGAPHAHEKK